MFHLTAFTSKFEIEKINTMKLN